MAMMVTVGPLLGREGGEGGGGQSQPRGGHLVIASYWSIPTSFFFHFFLIPPHMTTSPVELACSRTLVHMEGANERREISNCRQVKHR